MTIPFNNNTNAIQGNNTNVFQPPLPSDSQIQLQQAQPPIPPPVRQLDNNSPTMDGLVRAIRAELNLDDSLSDRDVLLMVTGAKGNFQRAPLDSTDKRKDAIADPKYYSDKSQPIIFESFLCSGQETLFYNIEWVLQVKDQQGKLHEIRRTEYRSTSTPVGRTPAEHENTKHRALVIAKFHRHLVTSALKEQNTDLALELCKSEGGVPDFGDHINRSSHASYNLFLKTPRPFEKVSLELGKFKGIDQLTYDLSKPAKTSSVAQNHFGSKSVRSQFIQSIIVVGKEGKEPLAAKYLNQDFLLNASADKINLKEIKDRGYALNEYAEQLEKSANEKNSEIRKLFSNELFPETKREWIHALIRKVAKAFGIKLALKIGQNKDLASLAKIENNDSKLDQLAAKYNDFKNAFQEARRIWLEANGPDPAQPLSPKELKQKESEMRELKAKAQKSYKDLQSHLESTEAKKLRLLDVLSYMEKSKNDLERYSTIATNLKNELNAASDPAEMAYAEAEVQLQQRLGEIQPLILEASQKLDFLKKVSYQALPAITTDLYKPEPYEPYPTSPSPRGSIDIPLEDESGIELQPLGQPISLNSSSDSVEITDEAAKPNI